MLEDKPSPPVEGLKVIGCRPNNYKVYTRPHQQEHSSMGKIGSNQEEVFFSRTNNKEECSSFLRLSNRKRDFIRKTTDDKDKESKNF